MLTVLVIVAVAFVIFAAAVLATQHGDLLLEAPADAADLGLPRVALQPEDVGEVRFGMALRGYRMSEVDEVLARLAQELTLRDGQIGKLQQALADVVEPVVVHAEQEQLTEPQVASWQVAAEPPLSEPEPEPERVEDPWPAFEEQTPVATWAENDADDFPEVEPAEDLAEELPEAVEPAPEAPTSISAWQSAPPQEPEAPPAPPPVQHWFQPPAVVPEPESTSVQEGASTGEDPRGV